MNNYYASYPYGHRFLPLEVTAGDIQAHINAGRRNHCFTGFWAGREHTFILSNLRPDGTVDIIENGRPGTVHRNDIVGLSYIGNVCPQVPPTTPTIPTTPTMPPPGGSNCQWIRWRGRWVWACW